MEHLIKEEIPVPLDFLTLATILNVLKENTLSILKTRERQVVQVF
jgi:hypothetical protein